MNENTIRLARSLVGTQIGGWEILEMTTNTGRVMLTCQCVDEKCARKMRLSLAQLNSERNRPGVLACPQAASHKTVQKAVAPSWQMLNDAEFRRFVDRLSSFEYRRLLGNEIFVSRVNGIPQPMDRKQAIAAKEASNKFNQLEQYRETFTRLYFAAIDLKIKCPVASVAEFAALPEAERAALVKEYNLNDCDWRTWRP